jgi:sugar/nucleoside kinase (ribokinase family)
MKKVLFIGDINVDVIMGGLESFPIKDREITCTSYDVTMGGTAVISACTYSRLGGDSSFLGLTGSDDYGDFMVKGLREFGVNTDLVCRTDAVRTGVTVNLVYRNSRTQVTYQGAIKEFSGAHVDRDKLAGFNHIHFAGPYLETKFIPEITPLLAFAQKRGITTSLDPQWDPLETWNYMEEWFPRLTYFFANTDEAVSITKASSIEKACEVLSGKTLNPFIKAGEKGVFVSDGERITTVPSFKVTVVDTTGAGDSFNAGFLFATLEKGMPMKEAARFGNAVAARSCMFVGGVNARSTYDDMISFMGNRL